MRIVHLNDLFVLYLVIRLTNSDSNYFLESKKFIPLKKTCMYKVIKDSTIQGDKRTKSEPKLD